MPRVYRELVEDDAVGTRRKLAEGDRGLVGSSPKVIGGLPGARRSSPKVSEACRELAEGDWELVENALKNLQKALNFGSNLKPI
ncbi:hypothetical protein B296_00010958 [Ensete ventricosum]|uniref:Uncharacterized protein n=1 Tax=Ensete ventricosum TaxID=4639 RepID=A0A426ZRY0_ENSVE|nr:hypothetical protein B296_00010958 [Ensete ventricosum]